MVHARPYSGIRDREAHGDVIVWPLKALCDYVEATGDLAFLDEPIAWRREDNFERTARADPIAAHIVKLIATFRERFIPGTHLLRYGNGDWNDSLQPMDPTLRAGWRAAGRSHFSISSFAAIPKLCGLPDRSTRPSMRRARDQHASGLRVAASGAAE